jgi:hypothetical protein
MGFLPLVSSRNPITGSKAENNRGYDFGYLMKILTHEALPQDEDDFFKLLFIWFPCLYDIKHVIRSCKPLKGGLQEIAESLGVSPLIRMISYLS